MGTLLGTWIGVRVVPLGDTGPELAGVFSSTYISDGLNFMAVARTTGFHDGSQMPASVAADNLVTAVCLALTLALALAARGHWLARVLGLDGFGILFVSALALLPANLFSGLARHLGGHTELGMIGIYVFLFVMRAAADIWGMLGSALPITAFAFFIVAVHMVVVVIAGGLLRFDLAELVIASNACVGGSASAGPIAAARGWPELVTPAILCGALGNAIGTFLGVGLTTLLR